MSYERKVIQGIPVFVRDGAVYTWDQDNQIQFGTVSDENKIVFEEGWEEKLAPYVRAWRDQLAPRSRTELRNSRKLTGTKSK